MSSNQNRLNTVLVVDDDCVMRSVACSFFSQHGVLDVLEAENGKVALDIIDDNDNKIDFILCDLQMPEMDGFQFLRHLNEHDFKGAVAILSGFEKSIIELARDLAENHQLQIVGALQKPLDFETLHNIYQFLVDREQDGEPERIFELQAEDLETAINSRSLLSYYQPKISLANGHIVGAEVVTYWKHHIYDLLPSDQFMELARENGLINNLETLQLETTFSDIKQLKEIKDNFKISLNIDMDMLGDHSFPDLVNFLVDSNQVAISNLVIEIRADQITGKNTSLLEILARLRTHGVGFALDHLGVSKSCLEHIHHLPFSELKLDKSIVKDAFKTPYARDYVESHVRFAKERKLKVTGLGVETPGDLEFLARRGADYAQGYFPAKPMPLKAMLQWFLEYESKFSTKHK